MPQKLSESNSTKKGKKSHETLGVNAGNKSVLSAGKLGLDG